jgi:hypothetical protein
VTCSMRFTPLSIDLFWKFGPSDAATDHGLIRDFLQTATGLTQPYDDPYHCLFD